MPTAAFGFLPLLDRGVVSVTGSDAVPFLDNLATNVLEGVAVGSARFAALLSPQGKILFEFFAVKTSDGFLLDTARATAGDLTRRLALYKLRAKVTIKDESENLLVAASLERPNDAGATAYPDPRSPALGFRVISRDATQRVLFDQANADGYRRLRIAEGIAEGGQDYKIGDTFPHEANYDRLNGVSFTKGCFVGQEVVARMQNKTIVRRRMTKVAGHGPLVAGAPVTVGEAEIGMLGSVDGGEGLALLRLDRALEARAKSLPLMACGVVIVADAAALDGYARSVADKPVVDL